MNRFAFTLTALFLCLLASSPLRATTLYVSQTGSDTAAGTLQAPWRTLQHGVDALKPGDVLLVGPGIYRERIEIRHGGTAGAPVTLAALPGSPALNMGAGKRPQTF